MSDTHTDQVTDQLSRLNTGETYQPEAFGASSIERKDGMPHLEDVHGNRFMEDDASSHSSSSTTTERKHRAPVQDGPLPVYSTANKHPQNIWKSMTTDQKYAVGKTFKQNVASWNDLRAAWFAIMYDPTGVFDMIPCYQRILRELPTTAIIRGDAESTMKERLKRSQHAKQHYESAVDDLLWLMIRVRELRCRSYALEEICKKDQRVSEERNLMQEQALRDKEAEAKAKIKAKEDKKKAEEKAAALIQQRRQIEEDVIKKFERLSIAEKNNTAAGRIQQGNILAEIEQLVPDKQWRDQLQKKYNESRFKKWEEPTFY